MILHGVMIVVLNGASPSRRPARIGDAMQKLTHRRR